MKLLDFYKNYPDEESCKQAFKKQREEAGIVCPKCGCTHHYWINKRGGMYQCAHCRYRQSLRANTVLHASRMPYLIWFMAMHLLTATKNSFSVVEVQRQVGWKYYQPVWEMMHKIREAMGKRDSHYALHGEVEIDEGFLTTQRPKGHEDEKLKAGAGSQRKAKVVLMAESEPCTPTRKGQKCRKSGRIKIQMTLDLKSKTILEVATSNIDENADLIGDASTSHTLLGETFNSYTGMIIAPKDINIKLPWVHLAIRNLRALLDNIHHNNIKREYLQEYLNEFCYKYNRRFMSDFLFERLLIASVDCKNDFMHRRYEYNQAA